MEQPRQEGYNIFMALLESIHKKDNKRLRFAKCQKCGRMTPFRLISLSSPNLTCNKCGNHVPIQAER